MTVEWLKKYHKEIEESVKTGNNGILILLNESKFIKENITHGEYWRWMGCDGVEK